MIPQPPLAAGTPTVRAPPRTVDAGTIPRLSSCCAPATPRGFCPGCGCAGEGEQGPLRSCAGGAPRRLRSGAGSAPSARSALRVLSALRGPNLRRDPPASPFPEAGEHTARNQKRGPRLNTRSRAFFESLVGAELHPKSAVCKVCVRGATLNGERARGERPPPPRGDGLLERPRPLPLLRRGGDLHMQEATKLG